MKLTKLKDDTYALIIPQEMLDLLFWDETVLLDLEVKDGAIHVTEHVPTPEEVKAFQEYIETPKGKGELDKVSKIMQNMVETIELSQSGASREEILAFMEEKNPELFAQRKNGALH